MLLKSRYPELPPAVQGNAYHFLWNRPDQAEWPQDFILHIDAKTDKKRTYREFRERVDLGATALGTPISDGGLGIHGEDGEVVGIISWDSSDYVALIHSLLKIATPFVSMYTYWTPFELEHAFKLTSPTRLFVNARLISSILPVAEKAGIPSERIYVLGGTMEGRRSFKEMIEEARSRNIPKVPARPAAKDTLAYFLFTGGTSGYPKALMLSHGSLIFQLQQMQVIQDICAQHPKPNAQVTSVQLAALSMAQTGGLNRSCFRPFLAPSTYVILDEWKIEDALNAVSKYKITYVPVRPSMLNQIINYPHLKDVDMSSIESMGSLTSYLPPTLVVRFMVAVHNRIEFIESYGLAEAAGTVIQQPQSRFFNGTLKRNAGSIGLLLPGNEARLVRSDGSDAGVNEAGELYVRGGSLALGYRHNEKATQETFGDGWLRTGDLLRVDEDGNFYFLDRLKDVLKVFDHPVSPSWNENILLSEPQGLIVDVCVAGVSSEVDSQEKLPRAWVVLSEKGKRFGVENTIRELKKWHENNLNHYNRLTGGIEVVDEIPKSSSGKSLRRVLQERYENRVAETSKA